MNRMHQIVGVIVRVAAIFIVLRVLETAIMDGYWVLSEESIDLLAVGFFLLFGFILTFVAIVLWNFPLIIARRIIPEVTESENLSRVPLDQVQAAAISVMGILIIVWSLSDLTYLSVYLHGASLGEFREKLDASEYASLAATAVELVFGVWLMLGSRGIVKVLTKLRNAGTNG